MQKLWSSKEAASGQKNNPWKQDISAQFKKERKKSVRKINFVELSNCVKKKQYI